MGPKDYDDFDLLTEYYLPRLEISIRFSLNVVRANIFISISKSLPKLSTFKVKGLHLSVFCISNGFLGCI